MIKNLKNWLKQPNKRRDKENDDPLLTTQADNNRMGRVFPPAPPRRVNFHPQGRNNNNYELDLESEDGGSEITLTTTAANEGRHHHYHYHQRQATQHHAPPVNPYSVLTAAKRNRGPRSCPGGAPQHLLDIDEELGGGQQPPGAMDNSPLDTRSEFFPQQRQHRRSSRRRPLGSTGGEQQLQQQPFRNIGNGNGAVGGRGGRRLSVDDISSMRSVRYKNVPLAGGTWSLATDQQTDRLLEDCEALKRAYQMERAKRKELQRKLKLEAEANERLKLQLETLLFNFGLFARQQQQSAVQQAFQQQNFPFTADLLGSAGLFGGGGGQNTWTGSTPSSSNAVPTPSRGHLPWGSGRLGHHNPPQPQQQFFPPAIPMANNRNQSSTSSLLPLHHQHDAGEQLAPMFSGVSLPPPAPPIPPRAEMHRNGGEGDDEVKVYRSGQHNTDSFSGSSRPTTGELREMEQIKEDLVTDSSKGSHQTNYSLTPESARMGGARGNATFTVLGLSLSADTLSAGGGGLIGDSPPPPREDDGYVTSETNLSSQMGGMVAAGIFEEKRTKNSAGGAIMMHRSKSIG